MTDSQSTAERIGAIASEGHDVRERVREVVVETVQQRKLDLHVVGDLVRDGLQGAVEAVDRSVPSDPDSVLRQVVDGMADGLAVAAQAAKLAIEEARTGGERFAEEDLQDIRESFGAIQETFVETVRDAGSAVGGQMAHQARDLASHAGRAAQSMGPSIKSALKAAGRHPVSFAGESASAGLSATRRATGALFSAMSGALQGAADILEGRAADEGGDEDE